VKRRPKDIGTAAETAVVRYLQANGFAGAERRALRGGTDAGDITGCQGLAWEVKYRDRPVSDAQITAWVAETETERINAAADIGILVVRRPRANVAAWWAVIPLDVAAYLASPYDAISHGGPPVRMLLADAVRLLRGAGYGDPLDDKASLSFASPPGGPATGSHSPDHAQDQLPEVTR
jgi:hypothetical protein